MRVLVATTAGAGHFGPLTTFANAFAEAGHEVRVAAPVSFRQNVESAGFVHEPLADADPAEIGAVFGRLFGLRLEEGDRHVIQDVFGRLDARAALPGLRRVLSDWRPDLLIREPAELASFVAADEAGVPQITLNLGLDNLDDVFLPLLEEPLAELGCRSGTAAISATKRWALLPESFDVPSEGAHGPLQRFREPMTAARPLPKWWGDDESPLVYATFGSVAASLPLFPGLYRRVVDELATLPVRVLLTIGSGADPEALGSLPPSVHVERFWPQHDVLPHAAALVSHGGFGTTLAALASGIPQVVLPLFSFDQFANAKRVADVGVGVALQDDPAIRPVAGVYMQEGPVAAGGLAEAVQRVLADDGIHARAAAIAEEIAVLPPAGACLSTVAELVPTARAPAQMSERA